MHRSRVRAVLALACLAAFTVAGCKEVGARRDIQEGNRLYYDTKYDEAIKKYDEALEVQPDLAIGWYNLGLTHLALFRPGAKTKENEAHAQGAITAFTKYLAFDSKDTKARDYLIGVYIDSGHYEGAIAYFEKEHEQNPTDTIAVNQLATLNAQAGNFDKAVSWYKVMADMSPKADLKADAYYSIGVLDWKRLYNHSDVPSVDRVRIADEGIGWLQKADSLRKEHSPTLSYMNLLYRQRSDGQDTSYSKSIDTASALVYQKQAAAAAKK